LSRALISVRDPTNEWEGITTRLRIGIFGGTFDPPHIGHLVLAEIACYDLRLDRVFWVLTEHPPHKQNENITSIDFRLEMLQAAIQDNPYFEISRVDIDRPGPHYAVDTVELIKRAYPHDAIIYLMGGDSLKDLPSWFNPHRFVALIDELGVMWRPGSESASSLNSHEMGNIFPGLPAKIHYLKAPLLDIASSKIRKLAAQSGPFRYYVTDAVYQTIRKHKLYSSNG
jgi:nicotinate-nucleotide adenylyltransferase